MVERIRHQLGLTTLKYQKLDDLVAAIGLPKEKLCTYCWDGVDNRQGLVRDNHVAAKAKPQAARIDPGLTVPVVPPKVFSRSKVASR